MNFESFLSGVRKCVEETRSQLNASLQEKLVAIDAVIRDHINKVFKNKVRYLGGISQFSDLLSLLLSIVNKHCDFIDVNEYSKNLIRIFTEQF